MEFLSGDDKSVRSNTSVCLKVTDLDAAQVKKMAALLEKVRQAPYMEPLGMSPDEP